MGWITALIAAALIAIAGLVYVAGNQPSPPGASEPNGPQGATGVVTVTSG